MFAILHRDSNCRARAGVLTLPHGSVQTPAFMPVGTNATVKAMHPEDLERIGVELILSNAYHLYLRPGVEVIRNAGGLHAFMGWRGNILTDSGGFQVFSLASHRKVEEDGVLFRSHLDGSRHKLTPEEVVGIQRVLGSDVMMPLDECTSPGTSYAGALEAVERTSRWAERSRSAWLGSEGPGVLFGIIQGNFFHELRKRSASELLELELPGYAIGGLSVGEGFGQFQELLFATAAYIPDPLPRYLMGVGTPPYILEAVEAGVDLMDCVLPTRTARNAQAFTRRGPVNLRNEPMRLDNRPIDPVCGCRTCRRHSRSYLRHLFKTREILAAMLVSYHNLYFLHGLMGEIQRAIGQERFLAFKREFLGEYAGAAE
ncbi:MAG: tRNA guanosine(34) transglycosylase Tgt [Spirochaetales bacterium]|nr:tRNA guanosine(34) transglycosylase Tgt [Spirochaetales bacterium]